MRPIQTSHGFITCKNGETVIVDNDDVPELSKHVWFIGSSGRPITKINRELVLMHHFLVGRRSGMIVDHVDRNPLNNSRSNLRHCTISQNSCNRKSPAINKESKFKGVFIHGGRWATTISNKAIHANNMYIGSFEFEKQAAIAYNIACEKIHGQYAVKNEVDATPEEIDEVLSILRSNKCNRIGATSKHAGVGYQSKKRKWRARIGQRHIGYFDTELDEVKSLSDAGYYENKTNKKWFLGY